MTDQIGPLAGFAVAITAERRREEFGAALARHGAQVVYAPAVRLVPTGEDAALRAATERCGAGPVDYAVVMTGMGLTGWIDAAERWGLSTALHAALAGARILARGPKARGAVRAAGLRESWSPDSESTAEVLEWLLARPDLAGARIVVQLHGDPDVEKEFLDALRDRGAEVIDVTVYRSAPPADPAPLAKLVSSIAGGGIDAVGFTSAAGTAGFLRAVDRHASGSAAREALRSGVLCAAVGPVTAAALVAAGIPVRTPSRARLGALVREITTALAEREITARAAGHVLQVRGRGLLIDGAYRDLPASAMVLLRELARRPGQVVPRAQLSRLLPGNGGGHAVEAAIARLRAALGDPAIISTVIKRGYRLAAE